MEQSWSPSASDRHGVNVRGGCDGSKFVDTARGSAAGALLPINSRDGLVALVFVSFPFFLFLKNMTIAAPIARAATPPVAAPTMIPVLSGGLLVESLSSEATDALVSRGCVIVLRLSVLMLAVAVTGIVITTVDVDFVIVDPAPATDELEMSYERAYFWLIPDTEPQTHKV